MTDNWTPPVHSHGPSEGPGLACRERMVDDQLRGDCLAAHLCVHCGSDVSCCGEVLCRAAYRCKCGHGESMHGFIMSQYGSLERFGGCDECECDEYREVPALPPSLPIPEKATAND